MDLDWEKDVKDLSFLMKAFGDEPKSLDFWSVISNPDLSVARAMCLVRCRFLIPDHYYFTLQHLF
jgi:hypothetical protein